MNRSLAFLIPPAVNTAAHKEDRSYASCDRADHGNRHETFHGDSLMARWLSRREMRLTLVEVSNGGEANTELIIERFARRVS